MEVENKLITNFELLKKIPEGGCFRKPDSNEIFMKTNKTTTKDDDMLYETQYCCVDISKGTIEYISNIKVIPISGKFVVNPDSHWTISVSDGGINTIPYNKVISNIVADNDNVANSVLTTAATNDLDEESVKDEEKHTCETCRDQFRHDGSQYCDSCNNYCAWRPKNLVKTLKFITAQGDQSEYKLDQCKKCVKCEENLAETLMFLKAKNAELEYRLAQCKEENKEEILGYCMDCKNLEYITQYDNNTKKAHTIDCCKHWSKEDNTFFAETVADGYCYMFEPKDDGKEEDMNNDSN